MTEAESTCMRMLETDLKLRFVHVSIQSMGVACAGRNLSQPSVLTTYLGRAGLYISAPTTWIHKLTN